LTVPFIAVLDYGIGNLRSAEKALQKVGADARLVTAPAEASGAAGIVLPGVGNYGACANALRSSGLDTVARDAFASGLPLLAVCVGMQLVYERSTESPGVDGLGLLDGTVDLIVGDVKRPQMQWNVVEPVPGRGESGLMAALGAGSWLYFVHSYAAPVDEVTVGVCDYGGAVAAAAECGALWATQFHPEKSGEAGLRLLHGFAARCGALEPA